MESTLCEPSIIIIRVTESSALLYQSEGAIFCV